MGSVDGELDVLSSLPQNTVFTWGRSCVTTVPECRINEDITELEAMACRDIGHRLKGSVA